MVEREMVKGEFKGLVQGSGSLRCQLCLACKRDVMLL
jgi:hypothetical protein